MNISPEKLQQYHEVIEELGPEILKQKLKQMTLIRLFEEKLEEIHNLGKTYGTLHLAIGQEATNVGSVGTLEKGDYIFSHHRGHGHILTLTDDPARVMAEVLGKATGYCRGRGGSMHIADINVGSLGSNGIVAGGLPMSVGVGLSIKIRKTHQVCMTFFGDGATNEGAFHETLNMAAIWKLPVIYVCENNQYAMSTPLSKAFNIEHISQRAAAYGMPGLTVDGNDFFEVYTAARGAINRARRGEGPTLIECITYRIKGHSRSDKQVYRTRDEVRMWQQPDRDPILRFAGTLETLGIISAQEVEALRQETAARINAAADFAMTSPDPDPDTVMEDVYA